ncbi:DUF1534 domain-containing protein [Pseudomonas viridiflava]|uniref:DUF1534 domain-containing protein n=1 Tax=Pseudomonas viridiflava TaxID=33069 RepID=A0AA46VUP8_PSEVI|nr:DUF1534 domain-containing protein [Pseudomonas viridiflava]
MAFRRLNLIVPTLQRGNAARDTPRHILAPSHNLQNDQPFALPVLAI